MVGNKNAPLSSFVAAWLNSCRTLMISDANRFPWLTSGFFVMSSTCYVAVKILPSLASEFQAMAAAPAARALQNYIEERSFSFFAKSRDVTSHKATPLFSGSEGFTFYSVTYCQCQRHLAPQPKVCTITPPFVGFISMLWTSPTLLGQLHQHTLQGEQCTAGSCQIQILCQSLLKK